MTPNIFKVQLYLLASADAACVHISVYISAIAGAGENIAGKKEWKKYTVYAVEWFVGRDITECC